MSGRAHRSPGTDGVPAVPSGTRRGVVARVPGGPARVPALFAYARVLAYALAFAYACAPVTTCAAPPVGSAIDNVATGSGRFLAGDVPFALNSNLVRAVVSAPPPPPALAFYSGPDYATAVRFGAPGASLFLQASAPACDVRPATRDTITLVIRADRAADVETVLAIETGPSTGVFRVVPELPTAPGGFGTSASGDRVLTTMRADEVTATLFGCGAPRTDAVLWIEPDGVVFASRDGAVIPGATVRLVDVTGAGNGGDAGGAAAVYEFDGLTLAANPVLTDATGRYSFPLVAASTYRIEVTPPAGFRFPSTLAPSSLPPGMLVDPVASYGAPFTTLDPLGPVVADLPVDRLAGDVLFVETDALRPLAEIGDAVDFAVRVANRSAYAIDSITVEDRMPLGFGFVSGTLRRVGTTLESSASRAAGPLRTAAAGSRGGLDADALTPLPGGDGRSLRFDIGALAAGEVVELRFRTRVGAGAVDGVPVNRAWAWATGVTSNTATATVEITAGPFTVEGTILGTVFVDVDGDRRPARGEPGIPGVRLWLDDGTFAITDADGRYSFYGIAPRTRALKVDPTTLPAGARLVATDARDAETPGLRFVDLTLGDALRADFAIAADSALVADADARRAALAKTGRGELDRAVERRGDGLAPVRPAEDPRQLPSSRVTTGEGKLPLFTGAPSSLADARRSPAAENDGALEERIRALGPEPAFVDLAPVDTVGSLQTDVRVKGPFGAIFQLTVNGEPVPASRIGRKLGAPDVDVEAWEFVGVRLVPGRNELALTAVGGRAAVASGVVRAVIVAPDRPARLAIEAPPSAPADGYTPATLTLALTDAAGVPVAARTLVTLEATFGRVLGEDLDPQTAGTQLALEGGFATVDLAGQGAPGIADVTARTSAGLEATTRVRFVPDLRPTIAVGAVEGLVALSGSPGGRPPEGVVPRPLFEQAPQAFVAQSADGDQLAAIRGSLFYKGRVKEDLLLTLGYDSERAPHVRAFRDLQPDLYYPLYGDASVRGFEAQSTRPLYARLDRRGASVLYGDFVSPGAGSGRTLGAYSRTLNGVVGTYENATVKAGGWTARERSRRQVDELRGRGVSGPYSVSITPMLDGSERVEVVVRDRDQPSVVVSAETRQRFVDYTIDPLSGEILLKAPLPSVTADLDPVYLRVTYEVEDGGAPYWTTGFEARVRRGDIEVGGSYVDDHDPVAAGSIRSVFAAAKTGPRSTLEAEFATTRKNDTGADDLGGRLEWRHAASGVDARAYAGATGAEFFNPTSGWGAGRLEGGGRFTAALAPRTKLSGEALLTGDTSGGERRGGLLLAVERKFDERWSGQLGLRLADGRAADGTEEDFAALVRGRLLAHVPEANNLDAYLEYEQDTQQADRRLAAIGAEMRLLARVRAYGKHELIGGRLQPWELSGAKSNHQTVFGFDANVTPEARVFSEYRIDGAIAGRDAEAVVGLRNAWHLRNGVRLTASLERTQPIGAVPDSISDPGATFAAAVGADYATSPWWKGSGRIEFRTGKTSDAILATFAGTLRIDRAWSALIRNHLSLMDEANGRRSDRERLQISAAYRPGDVWDALARYELRWDRDGGGDVPVDGFPEVELERTAHVVSMHGTGPLGRRTQGSAAWAGKWVREDTDGIATSTSAHWVHGRTSWMLGTKHDVSLLASLLTATHSRRGGIGAELGRRLAPGVWLSAGYNRFGYADDELTGEEWTRQGVHLRIRAKFDESILGIGGGGK